MVCSPTPEELQSARCALAQAYCRFASRLRRWVSHYLNGAAAYLSAEDVVQEAFCRTWERMCQGELAKELWDSQPRLYRWLRGTCRKIVHEAHRHRVYPLPGLTEGSEPQELGEPCWVAPFPPYSEALYSASAEESLCSMEREQLLGQLQDEVLQLAEPYRTVLLLRYWEEWDWLQIAQQLCVSRQTLYRWHTHAMGLLRQRLMPYVFWRA